MEQTTERCLYNLTLKLLRFPSNPIRLVLASRHDPLVEAAHENAYVCSMT